MSDVTLSSAVRSNLLSLQNTADMMAKTQERLATGLKVNSALDNPTNFFTASSLNSRAGDLGRLLDAVGNATQTLEAADNGISAITKLVESAQATARQAQQTSANVDEAAAQQMVQHWPTTPTPPSPATLIWARTWLHLRPVLLSPMGQPMLQPSLRMVKR
jgi:flagellin-like hook-associated protein FlgL